MSIEGMTMRVVGKGQKVRREHIGQQRSCRLIMRPWVIMRQLMSHEAVGDKEAVDES